MVLAKFWLILETCPLSFDAPRTKRTRRAPVLSSLVPCFAHQRFAAIVSLNQPKYERRLERKEAASTPSSASLPAWRWARRLPCSSRASILARVSPASGRDARPAPSRCPSELRSPWPGLFSPATAARPAAQVSPGAGCSFPWVAPSCFSPQPSSLTVSGQRCLPVFSPACSCSSPSPTLTAA